MDAIVADNIFKCIFLNENDRIPIQISVKFVPRSPIDKKGSIGSGNGLVPNRQQAITRTNDDTVHWHIYVALGGVELNPQRRLLSLAALWKKNVQCMTSLPSLEEHILST